MSLLSWHIVLLLSSGLRLQAPGGTHNSTDSASSPPAPPHASAEAPTDNLAQSDAPLPAESPALQEPEVNADNGGTEFGADAADIQTPVGAQG